MVGGHGQVYLMDWGVALERGEPASRGVVGTAAYMSPEQAWAKPDDNAGADNHGRSAHANCRPTVANPTH
jgi:serine/threonine protein kinase